MQDKHRRFIVQEKYCCTTFRKKRSCMENFLAGINRQGLGQVKYFIFLLSKLCYSVDWHTKLMKLFSDLKNSHSLLNYGFISLNFFHRKNLVWFPGKTQTRLGILASDFNVHSQPLNRKTYRTSKMELSSLKKMIYLMYPQGC